MVASHHPCHSPEVETCIQRLVYPWIVATSDPTRVLPRSVYSYTLPDPCRLTVGFPSEHDPPADHERWTWAELDDDKAELLGMVSLKGTEAAPKSKLPRPSVDEPSSGTPGLYHPDEHGHEFTMPDGVCSRLFVPLILAS